MKIRNNQSGSSIFEVLLVVLVAAVVVAAGSWVYSKRTQNSTSRSNTPQTASNTSAVAENVSTAPAIKTSNDLTKAEQILNQNDPSTANNADTSQLNSQLSAF